MRTALLRSALALPRPTWVVVMASILRDDASSAAKRVTFWGLRVTAALTCVGKGCQTRFPRRFFSSTPASDDLRPVPCAPGTREPRPFGGMWLEGHHFEAQQAADDQFATKRGTDVKQCHVCGGHGACISRKHAAAL